MENLDLKVLKEEILQLDISDEKKSELLDKTERIGTSLVRAEFKFTRTLTEKNAIQNLLTQLSIDLNKKILEAEEKSAALGLALEEVKRKGEELRLKNEELRKAQIAAINASKAKSQFLANMSHEIRTPMNGVLGMIQLLEATALTSEQSDYVETLKTGGQSLLSIINEILDFSKIEAGKLELEPRDFNLHKNVKSLINLFRPIAEKKGIQISCRTADDIPKVLNGDFLRIRQVLTNLIGNAIKFTDQGKVELIIESEKVSSKNAVLKFLVKDTGIGISLEKQKKLFQPFTQADASITRKYGGTGLGLTISMRLVELMGGKLSLSSREGKGSCFYFNLKLPLVENQTVHLIENERQSSPVSLERDLGQKLPLSILLAEDNKINQKVAISTCKKMGYTPDIAGNGRVALEMVKKNNYDIIFMDMQMPEMDGIEAAKRIRNLVFDGIEPVIIAMTANAAQEDIDLCFKAGMDDFIGKPFSLIQLQNLIIKWGHKKMAI